jgi:hypothetical protein
MGVDISGRKPLNDDGDYFSSNWWSWRPLHMLSEVAIQTKNLKMNTEGWGSNDGKGLRTQKQCELLASALEDVVKVEFNEELSESTDRIQICMGSWVVAGTGQFYHSDIINELNNEYPYGTILHSAVVTKDGTMVESAHSCSLVHIERWIKFLRNCGGFKIW